MVKPIYLFYMFSLAALMYIIISFIFSLGIVPSNPNAVILGLGIGMGYFQCAFLSLFYLTSKYPPTKVGGFIEGKQHGN